VEGDENRIETMMSSVRLLAVTTGMEGARVYWNGDVRKFAPPRVYQGDSTGAGDIFATAFFIRYAQTRDPWEAARFANHLASLSVTRPGLSGVPTHDEVQQNLMEIIWKP
jgi:sugar/nucleoside kinase (ribokinase family)